MELEDTKRKLGVAVEALEEIKKSIATMRKISLEYEHETYIEQVAEEALEKIRGAGEGEG